MKKQITFSFFVLVACTAVSAQSLTTWQPPKSIDDLPVIDRLPDLLRLSDGTQVKTLAQWQQRREEIKAMMAYYQYGSMPPRPDMVTAVDIDRREHPSGEGTAEWMTLVIDSQQQLRMRIVVYVPKHGKGPFPVVIREEGTLGRTKQIPMFLDKNTGRGGYIFVEYARHDLDPDKKDVVGPAQQAFPEHDWATLAVWAWGGMRVIDYLETRSDVDMRHIAITGHSRGGKMALLAGAMDERFTLVAPNGSGAGGAGSYTMLGPGAESLSMNDKPHWYSDRILMFQGHADRLPFDQHFLKALIAPRALLCIESVDDDYANPVGTQLTTTAANGAYAIYGKDARQRNGLHYRTGKHDYNDEDWRALLAFAEWHFFGRRPNEPAKFHARPYDLPTRWSPDARRATAAPSRVYETTKANHGFTTIGDPGNPTDENYFGRGDFGTVDYLFKIGKHQVTNAEYAEFLNAVLRIPAKNVALYHPGMAIVRMENNGKHRFSVPEELADETVTHVSWFDAVRFCNWLHNGKPQGPVGRATTEEGGYTVTGRYEVGPRNSDAKFCLPSDNEWFKTAYYTPAASGTRSYRLFQRDSDGELQVVSHDFAAQSAYGVAGLYDRTWEWNENRVNGLFRSLRSGAWFVGNNRQAAGRLYSNPDLHLANVGFRVVRIDPNSQEQIPNVLILGDSISMAYTNRVRRMLAGTARVERPHTNCGPTTRGLANIDAWLGDTKWDVIHFNFGLHDLKYCDDKGNLLPIDEGQIQVLIEDYEKNLTMLVRRAKRTGAHLIWCSTTPVPNGARGRVADDSVRYNVAALRAVRSVLGDDTVVNDLHAFCVPQLNEIQRRADVHFTPQGSEKLAQQVAIAITKQLRRDD